ncbi:AAA domain-containing protein [Lentinula aciculospora]|uniref:AAA domain-containing protein n=1 Tax=Lentinula aciculospora TaxID=153920 RepID=A0A9W9DJL6_9AGAR|nr:AAA domain-containing protein [Lentinula aciculospora]
MSSSEKVVLILVGFVGSGKSTFATALEHHFPQQWCRCNQDDLGSRIQVETLARESLRNGFSVCIDRTNIDESQRAHWTRIAHEFPGTMTWVILFDTPYEVCASRLQQRTTHPTIHSPEMGLSVLSRFEEDFIPPSAREGFHRIVSLKPADTKVDYLASDIVIILERVRSSGPVLSTPEPVRISWAERRRHARPYRGQSSDSCTRGGNNQNGFLSRVWAQWTVFPTQSPSGGVHPISTSSNGSAVGSRGDEADGAVGGNINVQVPPKSEDLLGVD